MDAPLTPPLPVAGAVTPGDPPHTSQPATAPVAPGTGRTPSISPTPVWAAQVLTFLCSIGTGLVTNGIFFLTEDAYGFTRAQNLLLMLVMGASYIVGAKGAGAALRFARRLLPSLSSRAFLMGLMLVMAALLMLPAIVKPGRDANGGAHGVWAVWVVVVIYSPLTGVLWPMVESFLSGGRSGKRLRSAIGSWNVVWSGAIIVPYLGLAALVEQSPILAFELLAGVHVLSAVFLLTFQREPAPHIVEAHEPHPPVYAELLVVFRMLLPLSYFVYSAMNPLLPSVMRTIGVAPEYRPLLAIAWLAPRTATFAVLSLWHGWHGKWGSPIAGAALLLAGFAMTVLSPLLGAGLAVLGVGLGVIYAGAIYYAMEVGKAEVEAGGTHEALIGLGYTLGPACGLAAGGVVAGGAVPERWFEVVVVAIVSAVAVGGAGPAVRHARRMSRRAPVTGTA